jgi:phage terminase small subunit
VLADKYRVAINHYLINGGNKRQACIKAGFSQWSVKDVFDRPDVQEEIERRLKVTEQKTNMDREWLLDKLRTIIEAEPGELIEVDEKGRPSLNYKNLSPSLRKAISKVTMKTSRAGGKYKNQKSEVTFETPERIAAIKEAAVLLGLREEKHKIDLEDDLISRITAARNWDDGTDSGSASS